MLGDDLYPQAENALRECRPDPEDMLQRARAAKEKHQGVLNALLQVDGYYCIDGLQQFAIMGAAYVEMKRAERDEQRWLKEIDNGD